MRNLSTLQFVIVQINDTDEELSNKEKMNTLGLCCYVEDMLRPALVCLTEPTVN